MLCADAFHEEWPATLLKTSFNAVTLILSVINIHFHLFQPSRGFYFGSFFQIRLQFYLLYPFFFFTGTEDYS